MKRREVVKPLIPSGEHRQTAVQFRCLVEAAMQPCEDIELRSGEVLIDRSVFRAECGPISEILENYDRGKAHWVVVGQESPWRFDVEQRTRDVAECHFAQHAARMTQHLTIGEPESRLAEYAGGQARSFALPVVLEVNAAAVVGAIVSRPEAMTNHRRARNRMTQDIAQPGIGDSLKGPGNVCPGQGDRRIGLLRCEGSVDLLRERGTHPFFMLLRMSGELRRPQTSQASQRGGSVRGR